MQSLRTRLSVVYYYQNEEKLMEHPSMLMCVAIGKCIWTPQDESETPFAS